MAILTRMDEILQLQAEVLKALSSPRRLEIIHLLANGPVEVGRLAESMGISQPNVSQHLALMRSVGVVDFERDGREVRYRLTDPEIITACNMMRGVLKRRLARMAGLSVLAGARPPGNDGSNGVHFDDGSQPATAGAASNPGSPTSASALEVPVNG